MSNEKVETNVALGTFPFPLTDGPKESRYLTWLRNHSNYMAVRGFLDYLRSVAVLVRGVIVNFLIFLPPLLIVAIVLAFAHHWMLANPFVLTLGVLVLSVAWILLFAILVPIFNIWRYKKSLETGSESSVKQRDLYERTFGSLLLVICATALLESLPRMLEFLHDVLYQGGFGWQGSLATVAAAVALLSGSDKLLSVLSGAKKKVAMVLIGILGLLVPLLVILYSTDFLLYGTPPTGYWVVIPMLLPLALCSLITVLGFPGMLYMKLRYRVFSWKDIFTLQVRIFVADLLLIAFAVGAFGVNESAVQGKADAEDTIIEPFRMLASSFDKLSIKRDMAPEVSKLVDQFGTGYRAYLDLDQERDRASRFPNIGSVIVEKLEKLEEEWEKQYFSKGKPFIRLGSKLSAQSEGTLEPLRLELAKLARGQLLQIIKEKVNNDDERVANLLSSKLAEGYLEREIRQLEDKASRQGPRVPGDVGPEDADPKFEEEMRLVRERVKYFNNLPKYFNSSLPDLVINNAKADLQNSPVEEIANLVSEEQLAITVKEKFWNVAGKAELDRLAGKEALAKWLRKEEILPLMFSQTILEKVTATIVLQHALPRFPTLCKMSTAEGDDDGAFKTETVKTARKLAVLADSKSTTTEELRIARVAGERLTNCALDDFDVKSLAIALRYLEENAPQEDQKEYDEYKRRVDAIPLQTLTKCAFEEDTCSKLLSGENLKRPYQFASDKDLYKILLAERALGKQVTSTERLAILVREKLFDLSIDTDADPSPVFQPGYAETLSPEKLASIAVAKFVDPQSRVPDGVAKLIFGKYGGLERDKLKSVKEQFTKLVIVPKAIFVFLLAFGIWFVWWFTVDVNLTSVHGLYRDRLASAFLVGQDTKGDVDIEEDLDLEGLCRYEARSTAPYHLVNVALNLQGSKDIGIRDRNSDFFVFSKRFIGGHRTGYCRSETMEQVFPQMDLATAMAISAAAASPNMGRGTSPLLVAFMALLNIRLGFWVPNPGLLEENLAGRSLKQIRKQREATTKAPGFTFAEVFEQELLEITRRWDNVYRNRSEEKRQLHVTNGTPTTAHGLVGIGFSGGGIRSAAVNLGITQALHKRGVFDHLDYMSTVSGGGYLGSSISTLMRSREQLVSEIAGTVTIKTAELVGANTGTRKVQAAKDDQIVVVTPPNEAGEQPRTYRFSGDATLDVIDGDRVSPGTALLKPRATKPQSEIAGRVISVESGTNEQIVRVQAEHRDGSVTAFLKAIKTLRIGNPLSTDLMPDHLTEDREYRFSKFDRVVVKTGDKVKPGQDLIQRHNTLGGRFRWRVRPVAFLREMLSRLDETHRWVNLSDGGHIENLATIELLRRRCKYIIIGDGEADPNLHFAGLATLMRCAYIDLGIKIDINLDAIRLRKAHNDDDKAPPVSGEHWAIGTITYPEKDEHGKHEKGRLLYLKSSFTGDEDEAIREYRHRNPDFPHQTTADQFFDEGQFEAYRALGQHIAEMALTRNEGQAAKLASTMSFSELEQWFKELNPTSTV